MFPSLASLDGDPGWDLEVAGIEVFRDPARGGGDGLGWLHAVVDFRLTHEDHLRAVVLDEIGLHGVLDFRVMTEASIGALKLAQPVLAGGRVPPQVNHRAVAVLPGEIDEPSVIAG